MFASAQIHAETGGAFDVTIGSLLKCWRDEDGNPCRPGPQELDAARRLTGTDLLQLDKLEHTVELLASPVQVDLGGIGKGYAVDRVAELLRDWSIDIALISGGYSSVMALDGPPGTKGWPLTLSHPANRKQVLARPCLQGRALSGSGVQKGQHITDPRTTQPVKDKLAAWSSASNAATADALSTTFMVMSLEEIRKYCSGHPDVSAMIMQQSRDEDVQEDKISHFGPWNEDELVK